MDWQIESAEETRQIREIKDHLAQLGFPEHILDDLTQEDLLSCKDARQVVTVVQDHPVNEGRRVMELGEDGTTHIYTVYDVKELRLTGIGVRLPGQREQWKLIHHFQWILNPGFHGTEVIQLWSTYRGDQGWRPEGGLTGRVLYNRDGLVYSAPYYAIGRQTYTSTSIFWGEQTSTDIFAEFSLPNQGQAHRGYVSYTVKVTQEGWIVDSWINYTHQTGWFQYPALTAKEKHLVSGVWDTPVFKTVQDALQFFPETVTEPGGA